MSRVVVLGGGPAGLTAALALAEQGADVLLLERRDQVGGNAGSFDIDGVNVDYGSHRLHPASDPAVLDRIRGMLGDDLLVRPRHGRIRLLGRWIHFPLRPVDFALRVHPRFALGVVGDLLRPSRGVRPGEETFATVLEAGLGRTICREFYFPYAYKLWGLAPDDISPVQALKRVSATSIGKMLKRLLPGGTGSGAANTKGVFYYPRRGFGQICEALATAARRAGVDIRLSSRTTAIRLTDQGASVVVRDDDSRERTHDADLVFSTIPITVLSQLVEPVAPEPVRQAVDQLEFRSMLLVYLTLEQQRFTAFDAHYFPGEEFRFTRISEPKNYAALAEPRGRTVLCAELPCFQQDDLWSLPDRALGQLVAEGLARAGLPVRCPIAGVEVRRMSHIYPLYRRGFERHFDALDTWVSSLPRLLSFGRQGLYVHDNTHHAMHMAQAAARCVDANGVIDRGAWAAHRQRFEAHVVED